MDFIGWILSEWTLAAIILGFCFYKWSISTYDFFEKKNVAYLKPIPLFGNFLSMLLQTESMFDSLIRINSQFKDKSFYGLYEMRNPILAIKKPELIKKVTVKDFDHFLNHRIILDEDDEPLFGKSLFSLKDQKWKDMRTTLSPAFTGSKMRLMYEFVEECGQKTVEYLQSEIAKNGKSLELDIKDIITRYTNDVVASSAFGISIDSLSDKNNEFYRMGRKATNFSGWTSFKFFLYSNFKYFCKLLKIRVFDDKFTSYFMRIVIDSMKYRNKHEIFRPDMIQLLIEARKGALKITDNEKEELNGEAFKESQANNRNWSDEDIVAQCFLFFVAGFETTSILVCFCAHELMENPEIQKKLFEEIKEVKENLQGKPMTYEVLQGMKYLDMVLNETLRKWPPAVASDRICTKPYILEDDETGEKVNIKIGDCVWVPVAGIQRDPVNFSNPTLFDPERFSTDNKNNIKPFTFLPFGVGPRNCIGSRFALMETKAIIFHLLSNFKFEAASKTQIPMKLAAGGFQIVPKNGFYLKFTLRK